MITKKQIRYKKRILMITILLVLIALVPAHATGGAPVVTIDGKAVSYNSSLGYPFIDANNRTQVPFRVTLETFGAVVTWDGLHTTAIAVKDGIRVEIPIGTSYIVKNTVKIQNDTVSLVQNGRTYLPIRAVLEAFGANVSYSSVNRAITVISSTNGALGKAMTIRFLDVGQGDSILIDAGTFEVLIDAGTSSYGSLVVSKIKPYIDGNLDIIVATHAHADHIGGLPAVIKAFQVGTIIDSGDVGTTLAYKSYYATASGEANCDFISDSDLTFALGNGAMFKILEMGDGKTNTNSNSIVSLLDYNNVEVLFMGDLDSEIEEAELASFIDVEVLKVGHHGSRTSSSADFLSKAKPENAIISAGTSNTYHHPHEELMARLIERKISAYGTFRSGDIILTTDGLTYMIDAATKLTMVDAAAPAIN